MDAQQSPIAAPVAAKTAPVATQPGQSMEMKTMTPTNESSQAHHHPAKRIRGGGAGKDCFIGLFGCFLCFECCEGCCDCIADIICCPCEMCC